MRSIAIVFGALLVTQVRADDVEGIQGKWEPTEMMQSGQKLAGAYRGVTKLGLEGGKYQLAVGGKKATGTYTLDPKAEPKTIDIKIEQGDGKGETYLGRYKLDGDTLTVCHALNGEARPTKLESTAANKAMLIVYKRIKQ